MLNAIVIDSHIHYCRYKTKQKYQVNIIRNVRLKKDLIRISVKVLFHYVDNIHISFLVFFKIIIIIIIKLTELFYNIFY